MSDQSNSEFRQIGRSSGRGLTLKNSVFYQKNFIEWLQGCCLSWRTEDCCISKGAGLSTTVHTRL